MLKGNKKITILIVCNTSWYVYNFRLSLIKELQSHGYEMVILAPLDKFSQKLQKEGCKVIPFRIENNGMNPVKDFITLFDLARNYKRIQPDVILHYTIKPNIYGSLAARLFKTPVINNITGLGTVFIKNGVVQNIVKLLYRISLKNTRKVFFQNKDDLNLFMLNNLVKVNQIGLLPGSGVNLEKFSPIKTNSNNQITFLFIGRLIIDKGILEYVEAAKIIHNKYTDIRFQILGQIDSDNRRAISKETVKDWVTAGIVKYLGITTDVRKYIASATCVVLPSYREGTPRTLLEAASMCKPVVTTNAVGCKDVVDDNKTGFLCRIKDAKDLSEKLERVINMSESEIIIMGQKGRKKMEQVFDEKIVIDKYLEEINEIIT